MFVGDLAVLLEDNGVVILDDTREGVACIEDAEGLGAGLFAGTGYTRLARLGPADHERRVGDKSIVVDGIS